LKSKTVESKIVHDTHPHGETNKDLAALHTAIAREFCQYYFVSSPLVGVSASELRWPKAFRTNSVKRHRVTFLSADSLHVLRGKDIRAHVGHLKHPCKLLWPSRGFTSDANNAARILDFRGWLDDTSGLEYLDDTIHYSSIDALGPVEELGRE